MTIHEVHKKGRVGDLLSKSPTLPFFPTPTFHVILSAAKDLRLPIHSNLMCIFSVSKVKMENTENDRENIIIFPVK